MNDNHRLTCGTCPHWQRQPAPKNRPIIVGAPAEGLCYGAPPSAVMIGVGGNPPQPIIVPVRPNLNETERACSLHPGFTKVVLPSERT